MSPHPEFVRPQQQFVHPHPQFVRPQPEFVLIYQESMECTISLVVFLQSLIERLKIPSLPLKGQPV